MAALARGAPPRLHSSQRRLARCLGEPRRARARPPARHCRPYLVHLLRCPVAPGAAALPRSYVPLVRTAAQLLGWAAYPNLILTQVCRFHLQDLRPAPGGAVRHVRGVPGAGPWRPQPLLCRSVRGALQVGARRAQPRGVRGRSRAAAVLCGVRRWAGAQRRSTARLPCAPQRHAPRPVTTDGTPAAPMPAARACASWVAPTAGASNRTLALRSNEGVGRSGCVPPPGMRWAEAWLGLPQGSRRRRCRASRRVPRSSGSSAPSSRPHTPTSRAWSSRCRRSCSRTWPPKSRRGRGAGAPAQHASRCRVDARRVLVCSTAHAELRACCPATP